MKRVCVLCGKEFDAKSSRRSYCYEDHYHPCPVCGTVVKTKDPKHIDECCCKEHSRLKAVKSIHDKFDSWPSNSDSAKSKRVQTCVDRYGVTNGANAPKELVQHVKSDTQPRIYYKRCSWCGEEFQTNKNSVRVCSKVHTAVCEVCGKEFKLKPSCSKTMCSRACAQKIGNISRRSTLLERYGVENVAHISSVRKAAEQTCIDRYGVANPSQSSVVKEKIKSAFLERYGVDNPMHCDAFRRKQQETTESHYGVKSPLQSAEVMSKLKSTNLMKYGVECVLASPDIRKRCQDGYQKRTGYRYVSQNPVVIEKIKHTCMERYGVPFNCMTSNCRSSYRTISKINIRFCELLHSKSVSYSTEVPINNRSYDVLVGSNLIEIDPTITHNSYMSIFQNGCTTDIDYHLKKTQLAVEHGYRCVHVFDWDDWDRIIRLVENKSVIYARNCAVREVDEKTANLFTDAHHIQGSCRGQKVNYGLYLNDELVEIMTFGKPRYNKHYDFELLRLCTISGIRVIGGASRLFKHFVQDHKNSSVISYCDMAKFSGVVYQKIGMQLHEITPPAKIWSKKDKYVTDNLLRQRGYDQLFKTHYGKGTSNEDLMLQNGWLPVYDCGQAVYVWNK